MKFVEANKQKNNRGMALVSVLIVITLIGLLGSSILNLSYLAYQRKLVEKKDTENFYANEAVIDTIKSVLQNVAATALGEVDDTDDFAVAAKSDIENAVTSAGKSSLEEYLFDYVVDAMGTEVKEAITKTDDGGNGGSFSVGAMEISGDSLYIRDVVVEYVNDEGYTSKISTDIVINAPTYASDEDVPLGTYSMFAGSGASIASSAKVGTGNDINNVRYNAQQGNVYFGAQTDNGTVSFTLGYTSENDNKLGFGMASIFSIGGTNAIFNGDVILYPGSTLIFTGGDGTEMCNIQVNGYIYLGAGSTLLLPSNVNLVCKGIRVVSSFSSDGKSVETYTDYTYTDDQTVSEFYPINKDVFINESATGYTSANNELYKNYYLTNKADVADILLDLRFFESGADEAVIDERFMGIFNCKNSDSSSTSKKAGVYMLSTKYTLGTGWNRSSSDVYYALSCTAGAWTCVGKANLYNGNITCNESDTKLNQKESIYYNESYYDPEYWNFVNVPILLVENDDAKVTTCLENYVSSSHEYTDGTVNDTYTEVKFSNLYNYYTLDPGAYSDYKTKISSILWANSADADGDGVDDYDISSRKFIVPKDTAWVYKNINWYDYTVTVKSYDNTDIVYTPTSDVTQISSTAQTVNGQSIGHMLAFCVNIESFSVQLNNGYYVGLFMSAGKVSFQAGSGVTIGVSILEMAKDLTTNGLEDSDNPLRIYLEKLATGIIFQNRNSIMVDNNKYLYEIFLVDNIINGGISSLWESTSDGSDSSSPSAADNSSVTFIDTENWSRE